MEESKILKLIVDALYKDGLLTDEDLQNRDTLKDKVFKLLPDVHFDFVLDHTSDLVSTARAFGKKGEVDKAIMFYSTFFEHTLNDIIINACKRRKISKKNISEILKYSSLHSKTGWLLHLLEVPSILESHRKIISKVAEHRNSYVHYKYSPDDEKKHKLVELLVQSADKTAIYMTQFRSRYNFKAKKRHIEKITKQ